jgi:hypothetical protein
MIRNDARSRGERQLGKTLVIPSEVEGSRDPTFRFATGFDSLTSRSLRLRPSVHVAASPVAPFSTALGMTVDRF